MPEEKVAEFIKQKARELGFAACGILPVGYLAEEEQRLRAWLEQGMQGSMGYMARNVDKRLNPALLSENAKTIIVVLQNYYSAVRQTDPSAPVVSRYAFGTDYHTVIRKKLYRLLESVREVLPGCRGRAFTDSAPVLERAWARRAGLGWSGKNSCLISPDHGSFVFIGELVIDHSVPCQPVPEQKNRCGKCTRCIDTCPTGAIISPGTVNANRCISYQTIELKGTPDSQLKGRFANRVFGCDICQEVCPWNRKSASHDQPEFSPSPSFLNLTAGEWACMDPALFDCLFRGTPLERTGYEKLKANLDFLHPV